MTHFIAGCSIGDLSPWEGVDLGGYPYFDRKNTGIHDPLYGTCLYLETEDKKKLLLLAGDLCYLTKAQADRIKDGITRKCGLSTDEIIISCSHSHSAPWMSGMYRSFPGQPEYESKADQKYVDFIVEKWAKTALKAISETYPAEYAYTKIYCGKEEGIGGNRTDPENGETDPSTPVMVIRKKGGPVMAIHTKYALHPTILHGENTLVSADYPGYIRKYINESYPGAVFMFSQGTSGNQSPRYYRHGQTFSEAGRFGYSIGEKIASAITDLEYTSDLSISHETMVLDIKMKNYGDPGMLKTKVEYYRKEKENVIRADGSYTDIQTADMWLLGSECEYNYAKLHKEGRLSEYYSDDIPFMAHAVVLNRCAYVFLQGELFVEYGEKIKHISPYAETNVITVSNGMTPGYCVTPEAAKTGGYEAWNSMLASDTGDKIVVSVTDMLMKIYEKNREERKHD
ncbi:MAG: hypothetical protein WCY62_06550 [Clostridia bacterium]|jgi:hypothetical protein